MDMYIHTQESVALFVKPKKKKPNPKKQIMGRMDKQTWQIHTMEYYLAITGRKFWIHTVAWMKVENIMLCKKSQIQRFPIV